MVNEAAMELAADAIGSCKLTNKHTTTWELLAVVRLKKCFMAPELS